MLEYLATLGYNNSKTVKNQSKTTAIMDYLGEKLLPYKISGDHHLYLKSYGLSKIEKNCCKLLIHKFFGFWSFLIQS